MFHRRDHGIETLTQIVVAPDNDVEVRRVAITNASGERRTLDVTSYAEIVLAPAAADAAPPGLLLFRLSNEHGHPLFVEALAPDGGSNESARFPLTCRQGTQRPNDDSSLSGQWEQTIPAIVVHTGSAPVRIRSIDPATVDKAFTDRERRWLNADGTVAGAVPRSRRPGRQRGRRRRPDAAAADR